MRINEYSSGMILISKHSLTLLFFVNLIRQKSCLTSDDDDCYENDITCIAGTSDIRIGLFETYPDPEDPGDMDERGYNFRFGPNMMAGPTRWRSSRSP